MTRADVEREYNVNRGTIDSPGKFEGEPVYAPYFYDAYLNGMQDDDDGESLTFIVSVEDEREFPELKGASKVLLREDSQGFVYCTEVR